MFRSLLSLLSRLVLLTLHVEGGGSFPPSLSPEEERRLLLAAADGDLSARNRLIEHNMRLVVHVVKKYYAVSGDPDDLISIGTIGLIKAIRTFDPAKNTRLATYAARCVENEIFMYFRTLRRQSAEVSLTAPAESDGDGDGGEPALAETAGFEEDVLDGLVLSDRAAALRRAVDAALDPREREIVTLRYGLGGGEPLPQREVARRTGISRSYVSRIEKKALDKIAAALRADGTV